MDDCNLQVYDIIVSTLILISAPTKLVLVKSIDSERALVLVFGKTNFGEEICVLTHELVTLAALLTHLF